MNINYKKLFFVLLLSVLIGIIYNLYKNHTFYNSIDSKSELTNQQSNTLLEKAKIIRLINSSEAKDFFNKNDALFLDARDSWEYSDSHILNAVNIPEYNFNPNNPIIKLLDKNGIYITYCSASDCDLSRNLATKLKSIGFKNVLVYSEGIEKWIELRYPLFRK